MILTVLQCARKLAIVQKKEVVEETEDEDVQEENEDAENDDVGEEDAEEVSDEESANEDDNDMDDSEDISIGVENSAKSSKYVSKFCDAELYFIYINLIQ